MNNCQIVRSRHADQAWHNDVAIGELLDLIGIVEAQQTAYARVAGVDAV